MYLTRPKVTAHDNYQLVSLRTNQYIYIYTFETILIYIYIQLGITKCFILNAQESSDDCHETLRYEEHVLYTIY